MGRFVLVFVARETENLPVISGIFYCLIEVYGVVRRAGLWLIRSLFVIDPIPPAFSTRGAVQPPRGRP